MKVYVIKSCDGCYRAETGSFINDLRQAEFFLDYDVAKCYSPAMTLGGCEIVEVEIMQTKDLADYTKQVRNELIGKVRDIARKIARPTTEYDGGEFDYDIDGVTLDSLLMWLEDEEFDLLKNFLDQIQGE